jgi:hypothetical protein
VSGAGGTSGRLLGEPVELADPLGECCCASSRASAIVNSHTRSESRATSAKSWAGHASGKSHTSAQLPLSASRFGDEVGFHLDGRGLDASGRVDDKTDARDRGETRTVDVHLEQAILHEELTSRANMLRGHFLRLEDGWDWPSVSMLAFGVIASSNRHAAISERQGNRNPLIDHPEWVPDLLVTTR